MIFEAVAKVRGWAIWTQGTNKHTKKVVAEEKGYELNADGFLQIVRKYSNIEELTTEILHEFIDKIIVYHKEKVFKETIQRVEIYYKMIGQVQIPKFSRSEKDSYKKSFGRTKKSRLPVKNNPTLGNLNVKSSYKKFSSPL